MSKFLILTILMITITTTYSASSPCNLDMVAVMTAANNLKSTDQSTVQSAMVTLFTELISTKVDSLSECKSKTPPTSATTEYTCCAGTIGPTDSLKTQLEAMGFTDSITLCIQTEMAYTFQDYFNKIQEQFSSMINTFTMIGCGKYNNTHMCNVGASISSVTCEAYPLNPENLSIGYDTCCLLNYDDFDGKAKKKCFDAPKKNIDYLKQVVKNYKNWGYKGVVVDCFGNYIKFGILSFFILVLGMF